MLEKYIEKKLIAAVKRIDGIAFIRMSTFSALSYEDTLADKIEAHSYFDGDELQKSLQKAILKLPTKQRLVFNMKYYDDLKYSEISEILKTSEGGLKASYHHAVKKIEKYINED